MKTSPLKIAVFVSAVGYAVDLFDLFLIPAFKEPIFLSMGVQATQIQTMYLQVMNWQLLGAAAGAILIWGPLADVLGRRRILLFSILLYSVASIWTAFVGSLVELEVARTLCGIGLGAELGAAITIISEGRTGQERTRSAKLIGCVGMLGVVAAGLLGWSGQVPWRWAFITAGVAGLSLCLARQKLKESILFQKNQETGCTLTHWKALREVFLTRRIGILVLCVLVGAPTFFVVGILVPFTKDYALAIGLKDVPSGALALSWTYFFISLGDYACGQLSEYLRSRKNAILVFQLITVVGMTSFFVLRPSSALGFYARCALTGLGIGYWASMTLNASEQFGTNLRGTVTVAVPNLVRLLLLPMAWALGGIFALPGLKSAMGLLPAYAVIGFGACAVAVISLSLLPDSYAKNLDYNENVS